MAQKIFVIEDDKDIRDVIVYILEQEKYEVIASGDSKIIRNLDNNCAPNLILMDNWLTEWKSDANGQAISKGLKTNPATSHIPIIIISAVNNIKEIAEAGLADAYLKKPFDMAELINLVKKFIK